MKLKCLYLFIACLFSVPRLMAQPAIIPQPVEMKRSGSDFVIHASIPVYYAADSLLPAANLLQYELAALLVRGTKLIKGPGDANCVNLRVDAAVVSHAEGYLLQVGERGISITAHDVAGIVYGIQTLRQLWVPESSGYCRVPGWEVYDYPRFGYRSMALDVSRHFFPVSFIKQYIDLLSLYKFNTFHWHLTDDQGWRIEIKQYPRLQQQGAWRKQTLIGHKKETPHRFDGKPYGGYYTQQEVKDVVQYAAQRGITIIPEIEMPGHALAALTAYPALGCTGGPYETATFWGVFDDVFCAGNDSVFTFLQGVIDEVLALFPSRYIHIGGDECPRTRWQACPKCQALMKTHRLPDEHALQSWFVRRMEQYINSKGRAIIGWDEILEGGLAPNATVMSWRGEEGGLTAARQKHRVIMTPESHVYFDYYQSRNPAEPVAAGHYTPLSKVYSYQPAAALPDSLLPYIAGVEGQAWSEYMVDASHAQYMIFPRALALAELAWTPAKQRNYDDFLRRLRNQLSRQYWLPLPRKAHVRTSGTATYQFDEVVCNSIEPAMGVVNLGLHSSYPKARIRYTIDGRTPSLNSLPYTGPVAITKSCRFKAQAFDEYNRAIGRTFEQWVTVHKATGAAVILTHAPLLRWDPGTTALVNGIEGAHRYNDAQWLGFSGDDLEAVIDMGAVQTVQHIRMNFLHYPWQRVWAPVQLNVYVSEDGATFKDVYAQKDFPVNGINKVQAAFPAVKARYVKVVGKNKGLLGNGEYGAGTKALLMIDEVMVD